jgi:hypothetical protein
METPDLFPQHLIRQGLGDSHQVNTLISGPVFMPLSHRADPATSHQAAVSMREVSGHHRIACVTALALYGPMTAHEVASRCGFDHWSVAARRLTELHEQGTIERIKTDMPGVYQTRKTPSGRQACLWRVVRA